MKRIRASGKVFLGVIVATAALAAPAVGQASKEPLPPLVFEEGEPQVPLTAEKRRAINRLLDRFVPLAVERRNPAAAYDLVTPALRAGDSREDWAGGAIPVTPYDARGTRFDDWMLRYSFPNEIDVQLILMPSASEKQGPLAFDVNFKKVRGRWLIDAFMPEATFAKDGEPARMLSVRDVNPDAAAAGSVSRHDKPRLDSIWFVVPGLLLLMPLAAVGVWALRELRWSRRARAAEKRLPDLGRYGAHN